MTVIAYRDGLMAADSGTWADDTLISRSAKIARGPDGTLGAACGDTHIAQRFREWIMAGMPDPFDPACKEGDNFDGRLVRPDGVTTHLHRDGGTHTITAPFWAEGSGALIALGALAAGATAEQAVLLTIEYHAFARGPVQVEKLQTVATRSPVAAPTLTL